MLRPIEEDPVARRKSRRRCPGCGEWAVPVVYGYPCIEFADAVLRGEVILGGCAVTDRMPDWNCPGCGREFGGTLDAGGDPVSGGLPTGW